MYICPLISGFVLYNCTHEWLCLASLTFDLFTIRHNRRNIYCVTTNISRCDENAMLHFVFRINWNDHFMCLVEWRWGHTQQNYHFSCVVCAVDKQYLISYCCIINQWMWRGVEKQGHIRSPLEIGESLVQ